MNRLFHAPLQWIYFWGPPNSRRPPQSVHLKNHRNDLNSVVLIDNELKDYVVESEGRHHMISGSMLFSRFD